MDLKIYLDFLDLILGSALMLQLISLGLVCSTHQHHVKGNGWLILTIVITALSLFFTRNIDPMIQSAFAGAIFTGSIVIFKIID